MTKLTSKISMLALIAAASVSAANAEVTHYVSGHANFTLDQDDTEKFSGGEAKLKNDNGYGVGAAVGARMDNTRAELELNYLRNNVKTVDADTRAKATVYTYMVNGYYDFKSTSQLTPYVGVGIGLAQYTQDLKSDGATATDKDNVWAYQGMVGVGYDLNKNSTVYGGYRYLATQKFDGIYGTKVSFDRHIIEAGYRYNF